MFLVNLLAEHMFNGVPDIFWGIFTFVLGLIVVFVGMAILVLICSGVAKAMSAKSQNKEDPEEETEAAVEVVAEETEPDGIPENVRVAIMAAVIAYYEGEGCKNEFVVKKIKKLNY